MVKRFGPIGAMAFAALLGACQEPDPSWGDVNGIWGKTLPGEQPATAGANPNDVPAPTTTLKAAHGSDKGKAASAPLDKVPDCMNCHTGNPGPKFSFGGRIETGGAGVADVVVTVTGLKGVKSDADGYFWSEEGDVAGGSKVTVQKGTGNPSPMGTPLGAGAAGGGCLSANCHAGGQGPIHP
jgi:hypothetical protein